VLVEAHELVDDSIITSDDFRDLVFTYPVEFWTGVNPDFFKGTAIERHAAKWLNSSINEKSATARS